MPVIIHNWTLPSLLPPFLADYHAEGVRFESRNAQTTLPSCVRINIIIVLNINNSLSFVPCLKEHVNISIPAMMNTWQSFLRIYLTIQLHPGRPVILDPGL